MVFRKIQKVGLRVAAVLSLVLSANMHGEGVRSLALVWATRFGDKKNCEGEAIAVDEMGNAYVTGRYGNTTHQSIGTHGWSSHGGDVFLTKVDPAGKVVWQKFAGGDGIDGGDAVATFGNDVIYVAGAFTKTIHFGKTTLPAAKSKETPGYSFPDGFVARFDGDGNLVWVRQFGGPAIDHANGVAVDKLGNVYVTGYFQGKAAFGTMVLESKSKPDGNHDPDTRYGDVFLAKYDLHGNLIWVRQAGELGLNVARAIAVDANGNSYITGFSDDGPIVFGNITVGEKKKPWAQPCFVAKYDANGNVLWAQSTAGRGYFGHPANIAIDNNSNVILGGSFCFTQHVSTVTLHERSGNYDVFVAKYRPNGTLDWCKQGGGRFHDTCEALAVNADGHVFIAGEFDEKATFDKTEIHAAPHDPRLSGYDSFMIGYNRNGDVKSAQTIHRNASIQGMVAGPHGSIWLTGDFVEPVVFEKTQFKAKTDFWGQRVSDTFVARYQMSNP